MSGSVLNGPGGSQLVTLGLADILPKQDMVPDSIFMNENAVPVITDDSNSFFKILVKYISHKIYDLNYF